MRPHAILGCLGVALASAALVSAPLEARAFCGFFVSGADAALYNDASQAVLMRKGSRTVLTLSNNYKGPTEDFAMVVPVPVVLQEEQVKTLPPAVFQKIDALSAPRLVEYWEKDPCEPERYRRTKAMSGGGPPPKRSSAPPRPAPHGVTVEAEFAVGEYTIVILSAQEATGLDRWLREHQYKIPAGADVALAPYIQEGMKFFVAKVDIEKVKRDADGAVVLSPLRFDYESSELRLPVRLGLLNANGKQDLIVYVIHPESRFEVANYDNAFIPTNIEVTSEVRERFGSFYTALFDKTLALSGGRAIVTEYAWQAGKCDPCPVPPLQDSDLYLLGGDVLIGGGGPLELARPPGAGPATGPQPPPRARRRPPSRPGQPFFGSGSTWVLTRLHARYSKETLSEDLVFRPAPPVVGGRARFDGTSLESPGEVKRDRENNFQGRYIIRNYWKGPVACDNPRWDRWGGPGGRSGPAQATAATNLGAAKRGPLPLEKLVRSKLASHGLPGQPPPKRKGGR